MTLVEEIEFRIQVYGGREVLARDIDREWGFFLGGKTSTVLKTKRGSTPQWSAKDTRYLLKWYKIIPLPLLVKRLGRSKRCILQRMYYLQNKKTA